jgi:hypothetical protein
MRELDYVREIFKIIEQPGLRREFAAPLDIIRA